MRFTTTSLRSKIFLSMILLTFIASIMILITTVMQYREEAEDYHKKRLLRKEIAVKSHINSILDETTFEVNIKNIPYIFKEKINEISKIHKMPLNLYDLKGNLLISSRVFFGTQTQDSLQHIPENVIAKIEHSPERRFVIKHSDSKIEYQSSYSYILDKKFKPIAILNLPYLEDNTFYKKELEEFLGNLARIYFLLFIISIITAYILSRYITKSLHTISNVLAQTSFSKKNQKINIKDSNEEISQLVVSYNAMVDKLEDSAKKLAQSEREQAWREMARQVAHEIKNPLTPMRLNIQSFQRKFDPSDMQIKEKFEAFSQTLIEQIDLMSNIASAFSDFAKMQKSKRVKGNLVEVIQSSIKLYDPAQVKFEFEHDEITYTFDKNQIQRVITNLIKNSLQAVPEGRTPAILIQIKETTFKIFIKVHDNGEGISKENEQHIFEPKFTTKSGGMGLGLSIVKNIVENHKGKIFFKNNTGLGTTFTIEFNKN